MIVPTKIFICVTPDENILGKSFLKNNLILSSIEKLNLIIGK